ncbi:hypothetical protein [Solilutibacter pythonis]|uniref:hypothetical protein n=1 Tax=Solilutibacter pythonis TaxID=2483112 RepID=UPI0011C34A4B|nr:hypothetical protein [Lysobacter pythonis]
MTTPLTAEQAISLLRQQTHAYQTPEQLRTLAAQVDTNPSGRTTVLYSGPSAKGGVIVADHQINPENILRFRPVPAASFNALYSA